MDAQDELAAILGREVDLVDRGAVEERARTGSGAGTSSSTQGRSMWRDDPLLLDMLLAAGHARDHVGGLSRDAFLASKLHRDAVTRPT